MENKFKVGDKVRNKFCPDEIGTISLVLPPLMGMPMYLIEFIDRTMEKKYYDVGVKSTP